MGWFTFFPCRPHDTKENTNEKFGVLSSKPQFFTSTTGASTFKKMNWLASIQACNHELMQEREDKLHTHILFSHFASWERTIHAHTFPLNSFFLMLLLSIWAKRRKTAYTQETVWANPTSKFFLFLTGKGKASFSKQLTAKSTRWGTLGYFFLGNFLLFMPPTGLL